MGFQGDHSPVTYNILRVLHTLHTGMGECTVKVYPVDKVNRSEAHMGLLRTL